MRKQVLATAVSALALVTTAAVGQDMLFSGVSAEDWSGFYAGVHVGAAGGAIATTDNGVATSGALFGITPGALDPTKSTGMDAGLFFSPDEESALRGPIGGAQLGYLFQSGAFVAGLEASASAASLAHSSSAYATLDGPLYESTSRVDGYGLLVAKAGVATGPFLFYGTAGLAAGRGSADLAITGGPPAAPKDTYADSQARLHLGYTVGAGIGVALDEHWRVFAEYDYVSLGARPYDFSFAGSSGSTATSTARVDLHAVRVGLNYRF